MITVKNIRALKEELALSAPDGGRRAVIIDAADEMNTAAANALLKILEEPPARVTLLLVAHQPARLLPTIRSRCRPSSCARSRPTTSPPPSPPPAPRSRRKTARRSPNSPPVRWARRSASPRSKASPNTAR